jgi:hypothetical protein
MSEMKMKLCGYALRATLATATALTIAGGAFGITGDSGPGQPTSMSLAAFSLPSWCPFGTHGGPGGGCRGGSIDDNQRLNDAVSDTVEMYRDAGECAIVGVVTGTAEGDPLGGSWVPAAECGSDKPEGQF